MKHYRLSICLTLTFLVIVSSLAVAQDNKSIQLPEPQTEIGKPLMQALKLRRTTREYSEKKLPMQELSNLLWAAWGINRPESGLRTAPSASNRQEIDVYVILEEGAYLYDAKSNILTPVWSGKINVVTRWGAPVTLAFISDLAKMRGNSRENKIITTSADTGFISQNVYLYCASQGLATVVRGGFNRDELSAELGLEPEQYITYVQSVGYPE